MLVFGHLAAGYLVTLFLLKWLNPALSAGDMQFVLLLGTIFGAIVDFDFFYYFIKNKTLKLRNDISHRDQMSHAPLLWMIIGLIIYFFSLDVLTKTIGIVLWISVWGHFFLDSFEYGVMWLYPFSRKRYSFFKTPKHETRENEKLHQHYINYFFNEYPRKHLTFWIELFVIIMFLLVYFKVF